MYCMSLLLVAVLNINRQLPSMSAAGWAAGHDRTARNSSVYLPSAAATVAARVFSSRHDTELTSVHVAAQLSNSPSHNTGQQQDLTGNIKVTSSAATVRCWGDNNSARCKACP
eukprot:GHUV01026380.1.p2 GENE.GHUV01026380.1~~GHUV01026380.1.p2  ORF type:complete len:113 (+),score=47.26 GHUV01026380.1:1255-1593(+)